MKIKDYLNINTEEETRLRAIAVFSPRKEVFHLGPRKERSPFEQAAIESIIPKANQTGKEEIPHPRASMVHLSQRCDHSCPGCFFGRERNERDAFLAPEKFPELLKHLQCLKIKFIHLGEAGEATLHPQFDEFAHMCVSQGFDLSLLTNASSLRPSTVQLLVRGFSFVRIVLDASDIKVYNKIHHPSDPREFEKVLANLDSMVEERNRGKSNLVLGTEIRLCQTNMNFMEQIVQLAKDLGLDYVQFLFDRYTPDRLLPEQETQVRRLMRELKSSFHPFPIYETDDGKKSNGGCLLTTSLLVIAPSGDVYPCPHFHRLSDITSFGNIFSHPPKELWFGVQHRRMVKRLSQSECLIKDCRWRIAGESV